MHLLHALRARPPQGRLGHPFPQRLPAHQKTLLSQVFRGQCGPEIGITLAQARQNLLFQRHRNLTVRGSAAQSVNQRAVSAFAKTEQHPPHVPVGYFQPLGGGPLRQLLLLYLMQDSQSVPASLARGDPLRLHGPPATHESGHFYFAQTGHSHFAPTVAWVALTCPRPQIKMIATCLTLRLFLAKPYLTITSLRSSAGAAWV